MSELVNWREGVIADVRSTKLPPRYIAHHRWLQPLESYAADPVTYQARADRSIARWRILNPLFAGGACGIIAGLLLALLTLLVFGPAGSHAAGIFAAVGMWATIIAGVSFILAAILSADTAAVEILETDRRMYLPYITQTQTVDGIIVCLADDHRTYSQRTFGPGDDVAALEYQVELEGIIEAVRDERISAYIKSCTLESTPTALPAAKTEQLQLELDHPDAKIELESLCHLLRQQQDPRSVA